MAVCAVAQIRSNLGKMSPHQELLVAGRYLLTRSGPGLSNIAEAGGFLRSRLAPDARPIRWSREILDAAAFAPFRGVEIYPGATVTSRPGLKEIPRRKSETIYHPVGSCRMDADSSSVVDCQLRVRGVECVRVADH